MLTLMLACHLAELSVLRKLEALDLSDNEFSGSLESQGKTNHILSYSIKTGGELTLSHLYEKIAFDYCRDLPNEEYARF